MYFAIKMFNYNVLLIYLLTFPFESLAYFSSLECTNAGPCDVLDCSFDTFRKKYADMGHYHTRAKNASADHEKSLCSYIVKFKAFKVGIILSNRMVLLQSLQIEKDVLLYFCFICFIFI